MTRKQRRFAMIAGGVCVLGVAVLMVLFAMKRLHRVLQFAERYRRKARRARRPHPARWPGRPPAVSFAATISPSSFEVTDGNQAIPVTYQGILPDLFREGQGVVAEGALDRAGEFRADNMLAKHDENYMPKEVADALKKQGHWKEEYANQGTAQR